MGLSVEVTTGEVGGGSKARGSRVDYGLFRAVGVTLADGNGSVRLQGECPEVFGAAGVCA